MEIISYVGVKGGNRSFKMPLTLRRREKKNILSYTTSTSRYAFSAAPVRSRITLHAFLVGIAHAVDKTVARWKTACAIIAALFALAGIAAAVSYAANHTGPLALSGTSELEALDNMMASFASGNALYYNESGDLLGSEKSAGEMAALLKKPVTYQTYTVQAGDTLGGITRKFELTNLSTIIAINNIKNARSLYVGQKLRIPSIDGMLYTVAPGNSLNGISVKFNIPLEDLLDVNDLGTNVLTVGQQLFIPGAKMNSDALHEVLGDLFKNPITAKHHVSSPFGWRPDPFTGVRSYHTGIDFACAKGTPIHASMAGKVIFAGWSNIFGNYVILSHANGYQTLYGHMDKIQVKKGENVTQATVIGLVGSTGYSTGDHLHFTVYKNGKLVNPATVLK
ncbi:MAG: M23 family metallopeptidase [Treponema sp.]|nr:M23 family metallopeptidase [Treponema sp.]